MLSSVSSGEPNIKEAFVDIPFLWHKSNAFLILFLTSIGFSPRPLSKLCNILGEPDSTPKLIIWQPDSAINFALSSLKVSTLLKQHQDISISFNPLQILTILSCFNGKTSS